MIFVVELTAIVKLIVTVAVLIGFSLLHYILYDVAMGADDVRTSVFVGIIYGCSGICLLLVFGKLIGLLVIV